MANALARGFRQPYASGAMARLRVTLPQGDPRVRSREGNVGSAFAVRRKQEIVGRSVVLVDDVLTSGATARECASALLEAGATRVGLVTACRS
jgi:predicted amidophosphoribosyltransferase